LLVKVVCDEGKEDVTRPRAALGLAADDGAANAELLAERSIIVIVGSARKTKDDLKGAVKSIEDETRSADKTKLLKEVYSIVKQFRAARPAL
jgi:hypothetical protein